MEFPNYDLPTDVGGATPPPSTPAAVEAPPSPVAAPEAPPADIPAASDPLFAPFTHQQTAESPEPPAEPAAPATPAPPPQAPLTPAEQAILTQGQMLASLVQMLQRGNEPQEPSAPPAPPRDPKDVALEQQLAKRIPAFGQLLGILNDPEKARAFQALVEAAPAHQQTVSTFYEQYADQTVNKFREFYADAYGVEAGSVTAEDEDMLSDQFQRWIAQPSNSRALARYEAGDIRVVDDFTKFFRQRFVDPARRQGQQQVRQRLTPVQTLPRGGGSQIPTPTQTARVVTPPSTERDVFSEAWGELNARRGA